MFLKASALLPIALLSLTIRTPASPFSSVVVYGDSLSDNGNLFAATQYPPFPYYNGRFSNGPVAPEQLATLLNASLIDFAWGGATTGIGNIADGGTPATIRALPGMRSTFEASRSSLGPYLGSLFVVWGGSNDLQAPAPGDATSEAIITRAVGNLVYIVNQLQAMGAQHILVPGLPDLGLTPSSVAGGPLVAGAATAVSNEFNKKLIAELPAGATYFDTAGLLRSLVANPAAYGFTNVTEPCFTRTSVCATPNSYLFWDNTHPTTAGHALAAREFAATAVPEPATTVGTISGLLLVVAMAKRRDRRAAGC